MRFFKRIFCDVNLWLSIGTLSSVCALVYSEYPWAKGICLGLASGHVIYVLTRLFLKIEEKNI